MPINLLRGEASWSVAQDRQRVFRHFIYSYLCFFFFNANFIILHALFLSFSQWPEVQESCYGTVGKHVRRCNLAVNRQRVMMERGNKRELITLEQYFLWMLQEVWDLRLIAGKNNCYQFLNICFNRRIAVGAERGRNRFKSNEGSWGGRGLMQRFSWEVLQPVWVLGLQCLGQLFLY